MPTPIKSAQGDFRLDQNINAKQSAFARLTYKRRSVYTTPISGSTVSTALLGAFYKPETDYALTVAHNYVITTSVINEVRTGVSGNHYGTFFGITAQNAAD